jgi:hypothetical protein
MQSLKSYLSRRKFTLFGLGMLSSVSVFGIWSFTKKEPETGKKNTVKMLAQDGTLVEVDASLLSANRRKVSNDEVQHWIKK